MDNKNNNKAMNSDRITDEELIKSFQLGDRSAFNRLVVRYKDRLLIFINNFMNDLHASENLLQDTFMKLYTHGHTYKEVAKFSTWIYTIAGNLAKTELRKLKRRKTYSFTDLSREDNEFTIDKSKYSKLDDDSSNSDKYSILINKALPILQEDFRIIIVMRDFQELSYDQISTILGLAIGTVKSRINRARIKLIEIIKEIEEKEK